MTLSDGAAGHAPVMVTGASGYVAGWIVRGLLERGFTVHATVRDHTKASSVGHLHALAADLPGTLRFFDADLLTPGAFDTAAKGCEIVIHTASPFIQHVADPQRDLVDPAVRGTRHVLDAVERTETVHRVVLTSSIAAMYTNAIELTEADGHVHPLTQESWNSTASLEYEPYHYSKMLAEREAWRLQSQGRGWDMAVINPALVVGPALNPHPTSDSFSIVRQIQAGQMLAGAPRLAISLVDVRDVAQAHIAAALTPEAGGQRFIVAGQDCDLYEAMRAIKPYVSPTMRRRLPRWPLPKRLFTAMAPLVKVSRDFARTNVGYVLRCDTSPSRDILGVQYRDPYEALAQMVG